MKTTRAILTGSMVWSMVFVSFTVCAFIPSLSNSVPKQGLVVGILLIPFTLLAARIYYKKDDKTHGLVVGGIMVITALLLDALITVPFIEIPSGGTYLTFYTRGVLWLLVFVYLSVTTIYWYLNRYKK